MKIQQYQHSHTSILLKEVIKELNIKQSGIYCDATFGRGGHSLEILSRLNKDGQLLVIDCDHESIQLANQIALQDKRLIVFHGFFSNIVKYFSQFNVLQRVDGILLDLGISSSQIEDSNRGFSFTFNGPLDMRMNINHGQSAADWLAIASMEDIAVVLKKFGEEKFSLRIARAIVYYRKFKPIITTYDLVSLIIRSIPIPCSSSKCKKSVINTFRAIRMYINKELEEVIKVLNGSLSVLSSGGKLLVISFHSLEDRLVKHFMYKYSGRYDYIPNNVPMTTKQLNNYSLKYHKFKNIKKILPSYQEKKNNHRSRSAVMRVAEKL